MSKLDELTAAIESRNIEQIRICDIARAVEREEEDHAARLRDFEEKRKEREQAAAWRQHEHAEASEWRRATLEHLTELNRMLGKIPGFKDAPADAELAEVKPEKRETFEPFKLPDLRCDWSNTHIDRAADFGNPPDVSEMMREANAFRAAFHATEAEINRMRGDIARLGGGK